MTNIKNMRIFTKFALILAIVFYFLSCGTTLFAAENRLTPIAGP